MWCGAVFSGELDYNRWFSSALEEICILVYIGFLRELKICCNVILKIDKK